MLNLGDKTVRLCLLDTNAVSEMVKGSDGMLGHFLTWSLQPQPYVPCFSVFTVVELRRSPEVFEQFIETFRVLPCVLQKGYDHLLEEEVAAYPDPTRIDPCAVAFTPLGGPGNRLENLPAMLDTPELLERERGWNEGRQEIVDGMVSLVPNYPPTGPRYSEQDVRTFFEIAGFSQIVLRQRDFAEMVVSREEAVDMDAFPSLKASLYTAFHKFYVDKTRKPSSSDAFDILIAAGAPYVEAMVTEKHQAEVLRQVQRRDEFMQELQVFTLQDFRQPLDIL